MILLGEPGLAEVINARIESELVAIAHLQDMRCVHGEDSNKK